LEGQKNHLQQLFTAFLLLKHGLDLSKGLGALLQSFSEALHFLSLAAWVHAGYRFKGTNQQFFDFLESAK